MEASGGIESDTCAIIAEKAESRPSQVDKEYTMSELIQIAGTWVPCRVDRSSGVAEFDQMRIQADPMTWPGLDRVLPLFEEEQVFMCRNMDVGLGSCDGALALDVGTGSGVFAIWAARRGCRVVAIDISSRAIVRARSNAAQNGIPTVEAVDDLVPGSICFQERTFNAEFAKREARRFHFVFLNPPYNPTFPGLIVALHANAGPDAQAQFRHQIALVPDVLSDKGVCFGNQMGIVVNSSAGRIYETNEEIFAAFRGHCHIRFTRMMQASDKPVTEFLREQYAAPLTRAKGIPFELIAEYIRTTGRAGASFSLLYFEIRRASSPSVEQFSPAARPATKWDDRVWIHHCILETATYDPLVAQTDKFAA